MTLARNNRNHPIVKMIGDSLERAAEYEAQAALEPSWAQRAICLDQAEKAMWTAVKAEEIARSRGLI